MFLITGGHIKNSGYLNDRHRIITSTKLLI